MEITEIKEKGKMIRHLNSAVIEGSVCAPPNIIRDEGERDIAYVRLAVHDDYFSKRDQAVVQRVSFISVTAKGGIVEVVRNLRKGQTIVVQGRLVHQEDSFTDAKGKQILRDRVVLEASLISMSRESALGELVEKAYNAKDEEYFSEANGNV